MPQILNGFGRRSGAVISIMTGRHGRHGWPDGPDYLMALRALRSLTVARYRLNRLSWADLPDSPSSRLGNSHFYGIQSGAIPRLPDILRQLLLTCHDEWAVMLLGRTQARVPEQDSDIMYRYANEEKIDGERIPQHVWLRIRRHAKQDGS